MQRIFLVQVKPQEHLLLRQQILHVLLSLQLLIQGQVLPVLLQQQLHNGIVSQAAMSIVEPQSQSHMSHHLITDLSQATIIRSPIAVLPHDQVRAKKAIPVHLVVPILHGRIRLIALLQGVPIHVHTTLHQEATTAVAVEIAPTVLHQEATTRLQKVVV